MDDVKARIVRLETTANHINEAERMTRFETLSDLASVFAAIQIQMTSIAQNEPVPDLGELLAGTWRCEIGRAHV